MIEEELENDNKGSQESVINSPKSHVHENVSEKTELRNELYGVFRQESKSESGMSSERQTTSMNSTSKSHCIIEIDCIPSSDEIRANAHDTFKDEHILDQVSFSISHVDKFLP